MTGNPPKKVVFILPNLNPGGAERVLITLMNLVDRARFQPVLIVLNRSGSLGNIIDPDIKVYDLKTPRISRALPKLFFSIRDIRPDIVFSTMATVNMPVLLLKLFYPYVKFVVREAIMPSFMVNLSPLYKWGYRILYPLADMVICPAQAIVDEFNCLVGLNHKNIQLLYNPVDEDVVRAGAGVAPVKDKELNTLNFVAIGRLVHQKGYDQLISALSKLHIPYQWSLTIYGEGEDHDSLQDLIVLHGLESRVSLAGHVKRPWEYLQSADYLLMPSRSEGMPNVVLESLACGTPVIATKQSGGIAEIAKFSKGDVEIVDSMDGFIDAMQRAIPKGQRVELPSLPAPFSMGSVQKKFSDMLSGLFPLNDSKI